MRTREGLKRPIAMAKLNFWNSTWHLDEQQCPCDVHFLDYLDEHKIVGCNIFHMGTGSHHIVGLKTASNGSNNQVLGITASKEEYAAYIDLLIDNPKLGFSYKAYFGDLYQTDARLLPSLDYATLFHAGEYRTAENDTYGALTDAEVAGVLAEKLKPGGEIHFYTGSFAYDVAARAGQALVVERGFKDMGRYKTLHIFKKP